MNGFNYKLINWRIENDYSQEEVAELCGISAQTVHSWETGKRLPGFDSLIVIASTMNVSIDWLLGRSNTWKTADMIINEINLGLNLV